MNLLVAMNHVARMQVLSGPKQLIQDVLFVNFFEYIAALDDIVEVRVWNKIQSTISAQIQFLWQSLKEQKKKKKWSESFWRREMVSCHTMVDMALPMYSKTK